MWREVKMGGYCGIPTTTSQFKTFIWLPLTLSIAILKISFQQNVNNITFDNNNNTTGLDLDDYLSLQLENISAQIFAEGGEFCKIENSKVITATLPDDGEERVLLIEISEYGSMFAGGLIVRVLLATTSLGDCSSSLAAPFKKYFGYYNTIGQLIISKVFTAQDLVLLSQRHSAFQGRKKIKFLWGFIYLQWACCFQKPNSREIIWKVRTRKP